jgi:hypothetical protein
MSHEHAAELTHIGDALAPLRAAIGVVSRGAADRVSVHVLGCEQLLPAGRALGRAAGVSVEPVWFTKDEGCDIVVSRANWTSGDDD